VVDFGFSCGPQQTEPHPGLRVAFLKPLPYNLQVLVFPAMRKIVGLESTASIRRKSKYHGFNKASWSMLGVDAVDREHVLGLNRYECLRSVLQPKDRIKTGSLSRILASDTIRGCS
jgi:hypothetical protein